MMIGFYDMRVVAQMGEAGGGGLRANVAGVTIEGTASRVIETWTARLPITTSVDPIVNYGDGATSVTDPKRMRKLTNVTIVNTDAVARTVRVSLETGAGIDHITGWLPIEPNGMVFYSPDTGWRVYTASGQFGVAGPAGSDGWSYLKLASDFANSTVTPTNVTGLSFVSAINTNYEVEVFGTFTSAATATGIGLSLTVPSGATVVGQFLNPTGAQAIGGSLQRASAGPVDTSSGVDAAAASAVPVWGKWIVRQASTAGSAQLQMRSEVGGSAVTLLGGSFWLKYRVIA